jgi:hypothetical protein
MDAVNLTCKPAIYRRLDSMDAATATTSACASSAIGCIAPDPDEQLAP